jgi:hypothetical protein
LTLRDYLRARPDAAAKYGALKTQLAEQFPMDPAKYIEGKTDFLLAAERSRLSLGCALPPDKLIGVFAQQRVLQHVVKLARPTSGLTQPSFLDELKAPQQRERSLVVRVHLRLDAVQVLALLA